MPVLGLFAGGCLGALIGLLVASLINSNCDSFLEQAEGCTRVKPGALTISGLVAGLIVGLIVGTVIEARRGPPDSD